MFRRVIFCCCYWMHTKWIFNLGNIRWQIHSNKERINLPSRVQNHFLSLLSFELFSFLVFFGDGHIRFGVGYSGKKSKITHSSHKRYSVLIFCNVGSRDFQFTFCILYVSFFVINLNEARTFIEHNNASWITSHDDVCNLC